MHKATLLVDGRVGMGSSIRAFPSLRHAKESGFRRHLASCWSPPRNGLKRYQQVAKGRHIVQVLPITDDPAQESKLLASWKKQCCAAATEHF